jgi:hypothetical protein
MNYARDQHLAPPSRVMHSGPPRSVRRQIRARTDTLNRLRSHTHNIASNVSCDRPKCHLVARDQTWMIPVGSNERIERADPTFIVSTRSLRVPLGSGDEESRAKSERTNPSLVAFSQQVASSRRGFDEKPHFRLIALNGMGSLRKKYGDPSLRLTPRLPLACTLEWVISTKPALGSFAQFPTP